jgi:hemoglobin-like flavoprotein
MSAAPNPIEQSFERAASRCADLTPLVYQRLFNEHPETRAMFRTQGSELVMGSMLALTIEAILDFAGERSGHFRLIACEVASHDAYGTERELFIGFFAAIRNTLRDLLDDEWSDEMAQAWDVLLVEIEAFAGIAA